ncbi:MAG: ArsR/SmtB family transcription factor, partial [Acidimicrobiales bacterium]
MTTNATTNAIPTTVIGATECCPSILDSPLDEAEAEVLAGGFAALSDPVRLRLLSLIAATDEVCSCDLLEPLGRAQPTVSH